MWINKSVFLLGTGASAASDFALPTMPSLIEDSSFFKYNRLSKFAKKYFPNKKPSKIDVEGTYYIF